LPIFVDWRLMLNARNRRKMQVLPHKLTTILGRVTAWLATQC
jgi:hypothetical protein